MKKSKRSKVQKAAGNTSRKLARKTKKAVSAAKKETSKVKKKARSLLSSAKKNLNKFKKKSSKSLNTAKDKVYATEEEILEYVKANPIKSVSALALAALVAGFVSRLKK